MQAYFSLLFESNLIRYIRILYVFTQVLHICTFPALLNIFKDQSQFPNLWIKIWYRLLLWYISWSGSKLTPNYAGKIQVMNSIWGLNTFPDIFHVRLVCRVIYKRNKDKDFWAFTIHLTVDSIIVPLQYSYQTCLLQCGLQLNINSLKGKTDKRYFFNVYCCDICSDTMHTRGWLVSLTPDIYIKFFSMYKTVATKFSETPKKKKNHPYDVALI